jgi:hypothetical protein
MRQPPPAQRCIIDWDAINLFLHGFPMVHTPPPPDAVHSVSNPSDAPAIELELVESERLDRVRRASFVVFGDRPPTTHLGTVAQHSNRAGVFDDPPRVTLVDLRDLTRADWETVKRAVDRAFDAFEGKWPSP